MNSSFAGDAAAPSPLSDAVSPRHRWKVLAAGVIANAAFSVAFSGIPMTAILMRSGYRLDSQTLGLALGLMGLGIALSELPWGVLTDRWGDRPVLLLGLCGTALALAAMALWASPSGSHVPPFGWLAGGLVLVGLLGGSVNGASGRAVMGWFAEGERGLAMSIRQTAVPLGGAIGAPLLTALAAHAGFSAVYGVLAVLCLGAAVFAALWIKEAPSLDSQPQPGLQPGSGSAAPGLPSPLRDRQTWRMAAGIGILCGPQFAVLSFGTVFLHDFAHLGLGPAAVAMSVVQLGSMALRIWSGRWTDRHRNRPAFLRACCQLTLVLFAVLAALSLFGRLGGAPVSAPMGVVLLVLLVACGICVSAWHGVAYTQLAGLSGAARAGTALGMANTSVFAVCFLVPLAIPHLLSAEGWSLVWAFAAACAAWAMRLFAGAGARAGAPGRSQPV
ncbi:Inner membrane protein yhjX [Delftia tsuruhatensis]|uniref:MFS transporter n=1 Tax=Delftia tsuruhatensis TaxID=180282 RepID=UPI001EF628AB|nr:MFS transporter [Delftia tsuruhatensis]CAB5721042.1 Inner membrane protein yhjX [Delftia tsuruhatensis]